MSKRGGFGQRTSRRVDEDKHKTANIIVAVVASGASLKGPIKKARLFNDFFVLEGRRLTDEEYRFAIQTGSIAEVTEGRDIFVKVVGRREELANMIAKQKFKGGKPSSPFNPALAPKKKPPILPDPQSWSTIQIPPGSRAAPSKWWR